MNHEDDVVARAREIYERFRADSLEASPLSAMANWVASGAPPPAETLRNKGFRADNNDGDQWLCRVPFIRRWGFSIPSLEAVEALRGLGPIVEIGAGSGYWTALLANAGLDIVATDFVPDVTAGYGFTPAQYAKVEWCDAEAAVRATGRHVFCSWPTGGQDWAFRAARAMEAGQTLALIALPRGAPTASPEFFDLLESDFDQVMEVEIPQFPGFADRLQLLRRR